MTLYTQSSGIMAREQQISSCLRQPLMRYHSYNTICDHAVFIGWGLKNNSLKFKQLALAKQLPFLHLEDGFIGYIGHPSQSGLAVSLISDDLGIYYDASQPCQLEQLICSPINTRQIARSRVLLERLIEVGVTKYNCYPHLSSLTEIPATLTFALNGQAFVLLVDQVLGDLSLAGAMATEADFEQMVNEAKRLYPQAKIVVRTHPDTVLGKKRGVLAQMALDDVIYCSEHCHPHALIKMATAVFTVSSQLGFEALWFNKPVHCFGVPFYAGWGLTHDAKVCHRRKQLQQDLVELVTLEQLIHAALIDYCHYFNPVTNERCQVEQVIDLIELQQQRFKFSCLYVVGLSLWKRAFMYRFCRNMATHIKFVDKPPRQLATDEQILVWGNRYPELTHVLRVEDGFIRSTGLGSNLCRPSSLVFDEVGIYFNAERDNYLRQLLNTEPVAESQKARGKALIELLVSQDINKYNLSGNHQFEKPNTTKSILLVIGQVDGDASITTGSPVIDCNEALLWAVRKQHTDAYIIYKPHPDVVAGNRQGQISTLCMKQCVDLQVVDVNLTALYPHIDELHTMTSLTGFEALLRGVNVVTWGQPFYSGWGLTTDINPAPDRMRNLDLASLCYLGLIRYACYIDWSSLLRISPEMLINKISMQTAAPVKQSYWQRFKLKLTYLFQTLSLLK